MKTMHCAIYTRKSSEEGLEQAFNSLDAQREACAAYILSQASEGWSALPDIYDDGGLSGGTLERPALQQLLADTSQARRLIASLRRSCKVYLGAVAMTVTAAVVERHLYSSGQVEECSLSTHGRRWAMAILVGQGCLEARTAWAPDYH